MASNARTYGAPPYRTVIVHGGPGAAGEMAPVAREMALRRPVLEPLQTASSVDGQAEELRAVLLSRAEIPVTLIGFSWGAWLGLILAGRWPELVGKLVLVASGPLLEEYSGGILETRLGRLTSDDRDEAVRLQLRLAGSAGPPDAAAFRRWAALLAKADAFDPESNGFDEVDIRPEVFGAVWPEAAEWRRSGRLMELLARVKAPVTAIHGDHDPHPAEGVLRPLAAVLPRVRFVLLEGCGHRPWLERAAKREFFRILDEESDERSRT